MKTTGFISSLSGFRFLPALAGLMLVMAVGCGEPQSTGIVAPTKPLTAEQEALLKQIEALPQDKRKEFITSHIGDVQKYSIANKTFGDRMNAAMGIKPAGS